MKRLFQSAIITLKKQGFKIFIKKSLNFLNSRMGRLKYKQYDNIFNDINNSCNCRCLFCANDFSKISKPIFMSKTTFRKVLELLPLTRNRFFFSCGFEPTLHPQFIEFLKMIPKHFRKKVLFTTNLATEISDEVIWELSQLELSHINISFESFNPTVYESLRKGARFERFIDNLKRLTSVFLKSPKAPPLRYIIMILRQNLIEIPHILERCFKEYLSTENEFRSSFEVSHVPDEWKKKNFVSDGEYEQLGKHLNKMPYKFCIYRPDKVTLPDPLKLFISSDGIVKHYGMGIDEKFDINRLSNPFIFFKKLREQYRR